MSKKLRYIVVLMLTVVMIAGNAIDVCAKEFDIANMKLVNEYTENGAHIIVYEVISDTPEIMPRFPAYKEMAVWVVFNGWDIVPPPTYNYKVDYDPDYKTSMSGTLYLKSSEKVVEENGDEKTRAYYEGIISGNI